MPGHHGISAIRPYCAKAAGASRMDSTVANGRTKPSPLQPHFWFHLDLTQSVPHPCSSQFSRGGCTGTVEVSWFRIGIKHWKLHGVVSLCPSVSRIDLPCQANCNSLNHDLTSGQRTGRLSRANELNGYHGLTVCRTSPRHCTHEGTGDPLGSGETKALFKIRAGILWTTSETSSENEPDAMQRCST